MAPSIDQEAGSKTPSTFEENMEVGRGWPGQIAFEGVIYAPAGFWLRLGAFLIDLVILILFRQVLLSIVDLPQPNIEEMFALFAQLVDELARSGLPGAVTLEMLGDLQRPLLFAGWLNVAMCAAYFTLFHGMAGATLGKLCIGLKVLRRNGRALGLGWAFLRYICYFAVARLAYTVWIMPFDPQ
ncbi:RDD family protein, partial [bacterium]|nr:RDD family protein [bacterium]